VAEGLLADDGLQEDEDVVDYEEGEDEGEY
jgi:hypothetical protein